jgi:hypothetical protein
MNCDDDIREYHDDEVNIDSATRTKMRDNRNANRDRMRRGLEKQGDPIPNEHIIQGSYAMKTMVQHKDNDYDIDDGAAFNSAKLVKADRTAKTPLEARKMVRNALVEGGGLREDPVVKKNCVRVTYAAGHHIDIPVYRRILDGNGNVTKLELASGDDWRDSNPREITDWFAKEEKKNTDENDDEPQLRRMARLMKRYSRSNLDGDSLCGLVLTILVAEKFTLYPGRDDSAFRVILAGAKARLEGNRVVRNPANFVEVLTKDSDGEKIDALVKRIGETLETLKVLDKPACTKKEARDAWDTTFKTDYFSKLQDADDDAGRAPYTPSPTEPEKKVNIRGPGTAA